MRDRKSYRNFIPTPEALYQGSLIEIPSTKQLVIPQAPLARSIIAKHAAEFENVPPFVLDANGTQRKRIRLEDTDTIATLIKDLDNAPVGLLSKLYDDKHYRVSKTHSFFYPIREEYRKLFVEHLWDMTLQHLFRADGSGRITLSQDTNPGLTNLVKYSLVLESSISSDDRWQLADMLLEYMDPSRLGYLGKRHEAVRRVKESGIIGCTMDKEGVLFTDTYRFILDLMPFNTSATPFMLKSLYPTPPLE